MLIVDAVASGTSAHNWVKSTYFRVPAEHDDTMFQCTRCCRHELGKTEDDTDCRTAFVAKPGQETITIVDLVKTCAATPAQWEGETDTGQFVYIRYRSGSGRIGIGDTIDAAVDDEDPPFRWYGDDCLDGYLEFDELKALVPPYIVFADGVTDEWTDEKAERIEQRSTGWLPPGDVQWYHETDDSPEGDEVVSDVLDSQTS